MKKLLTTAWERHREVDGAKLIKNDTVQAKKLNLSDMLDNLDDQDGWVDNYVLSW